MKQDTANHLPRDGTAANRLLLRLQEVGSMEVRDVVRMFTDATYSTDRAAYKRGYVKAWRVVNRLIELQLVEYEWLGAKCTRGLVRLKDGTSNAVI
jgi:hypothetical protein